MEMVSMKLDTEMLSAVDKSLQKFHYSTRTEFFRAAIREKLDELRRQELAEEFMKYRGKVSKKTTPEENKHTRKTISEELFLELEKRFN